MEQRAGRIWYSGSAQPPPLVGGEFADGWTLLGYTADRDRHVTTLEWQRAQNGSRGKPLQFYVAAEAEVDVNALPGRAWLGADPAGADGTVRLVSAAPAQLGGALRSGPPEQHPGLLVPHKPVPVKTSAPGGVSFRRAD
ncbi:hypothetical protein [Cellulomonas sp. Root137]|uniref:hypothetical protein n=1 Tax=Cellulomonas sp. Root137 TaxID=1736459 RepID=UPI0006F99C79|nr:hypothetical protein [Cellulomonas sp. Root137]KQY41867.1 hypothetical protein ASD18_19710 [Cellulomonas sp. Root137]